MDICSLFQSLIKVVLVIRVSSMKTKKEEQVENLNVSGVEKRLKM